MMRRVLLALVLGFALVRNLGIARADGAAADSVNALLARLAKVDALTAHFREEKHMALLATPLVSEGTLHYEKPRLLARHTTSPQRSSLVLRGRELMFGDASHQEKMGVDAQPAVRVLVDTFVAVLSGDRAALEQMADLTLSEQGKGGFRISVAPKDPAVRRIVQSMTFEGEQAELRRMELLDANGDRTITTFTDIRFRPRFSPDEAKRLFRIGG